MKHTLGTYIQIQYPFLNVVINTLDNVSVFMELALVGHISILKSHSSGIQNAQQIEISLENFLFQWYLGRGK